MWERTSANFYEVPWLSFEPKVSKLPSAWNNIVSSIFLTAESFSSGFNDYKNMELFLYIEQPLGFYGKRKFVDITKPARLSWFFNYPKVIWKTVS